MRVRFSPRAFADVADILEYLAGESAPAAAAFSEELERLFVLLEQFPEIGSRTDVDGVRRLTVRRFPYLVFYELIGSELVIRHIRHGARRPWIEN